MILVAVAAALAIAAALFVVLDGTPNRKRIAAALADVYLLDAIVQQKSDIPSRSKVAEDLYHSVLSHHGLTKTEFDSTLSWYSRNPDKYSELYHDVIGRLTNRESSFLELYDKQDSIETRINHLRDSLRHQWWKCNTTLHLPLLEKDTVVDKKLHFVIDNDTIRGGRILLSMSHVFPYRNTVKDTCLMQLIVHYGDSIADTSAVKIIKRVSQQKSVIEYAVRDTLDATKIEATLLTSKEVGKTICTLSDIKFNYMPYEITDSIKVDEIIFPPLFPY